MTIKTAVRVLELIELFASEQRPLTLSEISELLNTPPSSTHGLIKTLLSRGYLYELGKRQGYYFTKKLAVNTDLIVKANPLLKILEPILMHLRLTTEETVVLSKRQNNSIIYLDAYESDQSVRFSPVIGQIKPLHSTASGRALLGYLSSNELLNLVNKLDLKSITDKTTIDHKKLINEIEAGRNCGWYINIGQNTDGLVSIAIPIKLGSENYAVAVGGPEQRMLKNQEKIVTALLEASKKISYIR